MWQPFFQKQLMRNSSERIGVYFCVRWRNPDVFDSTVGGLPWKVQSRSLNALQARHICRFQRYGKQNFARASSAYHIYCNDIPWQESMLYIYIRENPLFKSSSVGLAHARPNQKKQCYTPNLHLHKKKEQKQRKEAHVVNRTNRNSYCCTKHHPYIGPKLSINYGTKKLRRSLGTRLIGHVKVTYVHP